MENLIEQYRHDNITKKDIEKWIANKTVEPISNDKFKVGQVIEFNGGYNNDIRFKSEITYVDGPDIYVLWDCYWAPIQDETKRRIIIVK